MTTLVLEGVGLPGRGAPRLDGVHLRLEPGQLVMIVGPNGSGKTSLVRVLAGLERPQQGRVVVGEQELRAHSRRHRAALVAWLPQHPRPEEGLSAEEVVAAARFRFGETFGRARQVACELLEQRGARALAGAQMTTLSGGEAQRVRLASLAAQEATWWLLDEPANHLDPAIRLEMLEAVCHHVDQGGGAVLVTHDLGLLTHLPEARVLVMDQGRVVHDLRSDDPDLAAALGPLFGIELRSVEVEGRPRLVVLGRRS